MYKSHEAVRHGLILFQSGVVRETPLYVTTISYFAEHSCLTFCRQNSGVHWGRHLTGDWGLSFISWPTQYTYIHTHVINYQISVCTTRKQSVSYITRPLRYHHRAVLLVVDNVWWLKIRAKCSRVPQNKWSVLWTTGAHEDLWH